MTGPRLLRFDTRRECEAEYLACVQAARVTLDLFDPDMAVFSLGTAQVDALLRAFLAGGGRLRLALHDPKHVERACPRFLHLLRDYAHLVECRRTPRSLHQLTDSFCVADGRHIVRRFHSDHMRGEAAADDPAACALSLHRFEAIWIESRVALSPTTTGL